MKFEPNDEYFQLCQGENTLNELYFYTSINVVGYSEELFTSVFGDFESYYINEEDIKTLSDFDFNKIKEKNFYYTYKKVGYLKIKCNSPLMLKHSFLYFDYIKEYNSGQKYYINDDYITHVNHTFNNSLINKDLHLKFTIFGLKPNEKINLILDNNIYELSNIPKEINFTYKEYSPNLFYFEKGDEIENFLIAEIIVGFLPDEMNKIFRQIDFIDSFGNLILEEGKGVIIKIPENLNDDLYDFFILFPGENHTQTYNNLFYFDILYDKLEFQVIYKKEWRYKTAPIIPLFRVNPYEHIKNNSLLNIDNNKYFYILIYNYYNQKKVQIKKPMLYSNIKLNTINVLPQLNENNKKYYYQIKLPEPQGDYNSLLIQTINTGFPIKMTLSKSYIQYPFKLYYNFFYHHFNVPYDKRDKNQILYLNYYDVDSTPGYINFVGTNEHIYPDNYIIFDLDQELEQINGTNKINIKMNSLSYVFYPNIVKYYLIVNTENNYNILYSILTGQKELNKSNHEFMTIVEDDGSKEKFKTTIQVDIDLNEE